MGRKCVLWVCGQPVVAGAVGRGWGGNVCCGFVVNHTYKWW